MSTTDPELEELLARTRTVRPAPHLGERVTRAAARAWDERHPARTDVAWPAPVFRLAACLAVVAILMAAGNWINDASLYAWRQAMVPPATTGGPPDLDLQGIPPTLATYAGLGGVPRRTPTHSLDAGRSLSHRDELLRRLLDPDAETDPSPSELWNPQGRLDQNRQILGRFWS